jgi:hypothetical protein
MSTYLVTLSDGRIAEVEATELTTRPCGALFLMAAVARPPAALVTVAAFAARTWTSCVPKDSTAVLFHESPPAAHVPAQPTTARFA